MTDAESTWAHLAVRHLNAFLAKVSPPTQVLEAEALAPYTVAVFIGTGRCALLVALRRHRVDLQAVGTWGSEVLRPRSWAEFGLACVPANPKAASPDFVRCRDEFARQCLKAMDGSEIRWFDQPVPIALTKQDEVPPPVEKPAKVQVATPRVAVGPLAGGPVDAGDGEFPPLNQDVPGEARSGITLVPPGS